MGLTFLGGVGLLSFRPDRVLVTRRALDYLESRDEDAIIDALRQNVYGFDEIIEALKDRSPLPREELLQACKESLAKKGVGTRWRESTAETQFGTALAYLRSYRIIDTIAGQFYLVSKGLEKADQLIVARALSPEESIRLSHREVEEKLRELGDFFQFETSIRTSVNVILPAPRRLTREDRQLDGLWTRSLPFSGNLYYPIEIHIGGSIADAIERLEMVHEFAQKCIIVADPADQEKIKGRLQARRSKLVDKVVFVTVEDVNKALEAASALKSIASAVFG